MTTCDVLGGEIIDLRDIIARVEEIEDDEDESEELSLLTGLLDELRGYGGDEQWRGDWYPITLIHDDYFERYMDEMLEDCGDLPKNLPSYLKITIDYDALKTDYTEVDVDGQTYLYR